MLFNPFSQRKIYLDYAAGTNPNPSSIHVPGVVKKRELQEARKNIAKLLAVKPDEIVFTSGGTESNNLAILGVFRAAKKRISKPHIVTSNIEHSSVLGAVRQAEREGAEVTYLRAREDGVIDISELEKLIKPETVLVSLMHANNETGTMQPVREAGLIIQKYNNSKFEIRNSKLFYHIDACQTAGYKSIEAHAFCADLLTVSGQKVYGPRGTGFLFVKNGTEIESLMYGGGQERGLRPGTENTEGQIAFARAFFKVQKNRNQESERLAELRQYFIKELDSIAQDCLVHNGSKSHQLPNIINVSFRNIASDRMVLELDAKGIAVSGGSACNAGQSEYSQIIAVMKGEEVARGAVRFSFGRSTTEKDIKIVLNAISAILKSHGRTQ